MTPFHHHKLPDRTALLSGCEPHEALAFHSDQLQILYCNTAESWVGDGERPHIHTRSDEAFVLLSGSLIVEVEGEPHSIGPREFCCFPAGMYHAILSVEPPIEMLVLRAPSVGDKAYR